MSKPIDSAELRSIIDESVRAIAADKAKEAVEGALDGLTAETFRKWEAQMRDLEKVADRMQAQEEGTDGSSEIIQTLAGARSFSKGYAKRARTFIESDPLGGCGLEFARFCRAIAWEKKLEGRVAAKDLALKEWDDRATADRLDIAADNDVLRTKSRALGVDIASDGGYLVPEDQNNEIIGLLRAKSVILGQGVRIMPMVSKSMPIPALNTGVTTTWVGESQSVNAVAPTFKRRTLDLHKARTIVPMSYEFFSQAGPMADAIVRDDIAQSKALAFDLAFIRGLGTSDSPRGLKHLAAAANRSDIADQASFTLAEVKGIMRGMIQDLEGSNVDITGAKWVFHSVIKSALLRIADANSNTPYEKGIEGSGQVHGYEFGVSNQIPTNLDKSGNATNDETEMMFYQPASVLVGRLAEGMTIKAHEGATYKDSSGNLVSGLSDDEVVLATRDFTGIQTRHDEAVSYREAVDWSTTI